MADIPAPQIVIVGERVVLPESRQTPTFAEIARTTASQAAVRARIAPEPGKVPAATTIDQDHVLNRTGGK